MRNGGSGGGGGGGNMMAPVMAMEEQISMRQQQVSVVHSCGVAKLAICTRTVHVLNAHVCAHAVYVLYDRCLYPYIGRTCTCTSCTSIVYLL